MSQLTADSGAQLPDLEKTFAQVDPEQVNCADRSGGLIAKALIGVGLVLILVTALVGFFSDEKIGAHALAAYYIGMIVALGFCLGGLGYTMIMHQFNAGWSATVRRQMENLASMTPLVLVLFLPILIIEFASGGVLWHWLSPEYTDGDVLFSHKSGWFSPSFFVLRAVLYFAIWIGLGTRLYRNSRMQDRTGDRWITARSRFISSFGLLLYALSMAFASFDWMMSMDYHWFSTMFGVQFFAGNILSTTALLVLTFVVLKLKGYLGNWVTDEHFHDMGKLLLSFTVFWAYISFSQYFLIWYSNIPEETAWYHLRKQHNWETVFFVLIFGHFMLPFLILLFRPVKKSLPVIGAVAAWIVVMHIIDVFYVIRPVVYGAGGDGFGHIWVDLLGILGPVALFMGVLIWRIASAPLIPIKDPRLGEALAHKNYV